MKWLSGERVDGARELVQQERADLLAFLETLTPSEWEAPSLCSGWQVRDVVAHVLIYDSFQPSQVWLLIRSGFSGDRLNMRTAEAWRGRSPTELLDCLRANLIPGGITRLFGWPTALQEAMVHHQDVRRPLNRPRDIPPERIERVLANMIDAPVLAGLPNHAKGIRLEATDIDWRTGEGPLVTGTGEAIMMALAGRPQVLQELNGAGVDLLRARLSAT